MKITFKKLIKAVVPYGLIVLFRYLKTKPSGFDWLMSENEKKVFVRYISTAKVYLEFGSGGSTIAGLMHSPGKIYSIESSKEWMQLMRNKHTIITQSENIGKLCFIHADIGETGGAGMPIISWDENETDFERFLNYSQKVFTEYPSIKDADVVLIDGRFRVACCMSVLLETKKDTLILVHDFWNRPCYHAIKKYVDVLDRVDSIIVCKRNINVSDDAIKKEYEHYKYNYE